MVAVLHSAVTAAHGLFSCFFSVVAVAIILTTTVVTTTVVATTAATIILTLVVVATNLISLEGLSFGSPNLFVIKTSP